MEPCFVLGLFDTGLAAVRALSRAGLTVFGFDSQSDQVGFRSRFGSHAVCPDPHASPAELAAFLRARAQQIGSRPILYPTSDSFVIFVSQNREALDRSFHYALPSRESVAAAINKATQYARAAAAGVPIAPTHTPRTLDDVHVLARSIEYPAVVKPLVGHVGRESLGGDEAMAVDNAAALVALFQQILRGDQAALVQSFIAGPTRIIARYAHTSTKPAASWR